MESSEEFEVIDVVRAYSPKLPALLSMLCSYAIIREVWISNNGRCIFQARDKTMERFLIAMSIGDLFMSFPYFLTTWAAPANTPGHFQSVGTIGTCTMQGVFLRTSNLH